MASKDTESLGPLTGDATSGHLVKVLLASFSWKVTIFAFVTDKGLVGRCSEATQISCFFHPRILASAGDSCPNQLFTRMVAEMAAFELNQFFLL